MLLFSRKLFLKKFRAHFHEASDKRFPKMNPSLQVPILFLALLVETSRAYAIPRCLSVRLSVRPSVRLAVCPSVNNYCYRISSEAIYHRDFFIVPVCWPYGVVVHLRL